MPDINDVLIVTAKIPDEIEAGQPLPVNVEITNVSDFPVVVNKRLSVGYRNSLSRELFVLVFIAGTHVESGIQKLLYERPFSTGEDYIRLKPDEKIKKEFNLFEWYEMPKAGKYDISVCYQADEDLAYKPDDVVKGVFCAEKKTVNIKAAD
jgi:hypothetical protein